MRYPAPHVAIVGELLKAPGGMNCFDTTRKIKWPMPKSTCAQHSRILLEAGLIAGERKGVAYQAVSARRSLRHDFQACCQLF
jgi:hypothetical protein